MKRRLQISPQKTVAWMCGIAGAIALDGNPIPKLDSALAVMGKLIAHRGPDGEGHWCSPKRDCGLAHRRLAIIDVSTAGQQPMVGKNGSVISFNGEIYNYRELKSELRDFWPFKSEADTETILAAHAKWGLDGVSKLRGMFAYAIWTDEEFVAVRDRFGIKPFYYAIVDSIFYFASEIKALLPILPGVETEPDALAEYMTFQYTIGTKTLFKHVMSLAPGHILVIKRGEIIIRKYWDIHYNVDLNHTPHWFAEEMRARLSESVDMHLRSDVPVGAYVSGGIDSSLMAVLAARRPSFGHLGFHGKFTDYAGYDESAYAELVCVENGIELKQIDIQAADFEAHLEQVIYHLDTPVAGPGAFPQFMVSKLAAESVKVVLGGQGGDEIFGGYARYLIAYLEQVINAAIDGTYQNGNFVVTPESIIPHLQVLQEYKPLIQQQFSRGLFGPPDQRYLNLIDRSGDVFGEVDWSLLDRAGVVERYLAIFNSARNVRKEAYLDSMMHFDFKCLLPALLQVEDRMSMAHSLESRVPLLDHSIVELAATIPANIKFKGGQMKHFLKECFSGDLSSRLLHRRDKMGFPVPLKEWSAGPLRDFMTDVFSNESFRHRAYFNAEVILDNFDRTGRYSRKTWGLLSLELWHRCFHDRAGQYRAMIDNIRPVELQMN
ncbi:asparagine synthase (glutamine-hydrolyzing) [Methylobacterium sp. A49B]